LSVGLQRGRRIKKKGSEKAGLGDGASLVENISSTLKGRPSFRGGLGQKKGIASNASHEGGRRKGVELGRGCRRLGSRLKKKTRERSRQKKTNAANAALQRPAARKELRMPPIPRVKNTTGKKTKEKRKRERRKERKKLVRKANKDAKKRKRTERSP